MSYQSAVQFIVEQTSYNQHDSFWCHFYHLILSVFFHLRNHSLVSHYPPCSTPYHQHRQVFYQFFWPPNIPLVVTIVSNYPSTDHCQVHLVTVYRPVLSRELVAVGSACWRWNCAHIGTDWYDDETLYDHWTLPHSSIWRIALLNCWNRLSSVLEDF